MILFSWFFVTQENSWRQEKRRKRLKEYGGLDGYFSYLHAHHDNEREREDEEKEERNEGTTSFLWTSLQIRQQRMNLDSSFSFSTEGKTFSSLFLSSFCQESFSALSLSFSLSLVQYFSCVSFVSSSSPVCPSVPYILSLSFYSALLCSCPEKGEKRWLRMNMTEVMSKLKRRKQTAGNRAVHSKDRMWVPQT